MASKPWQKYQVYFDRSFKRKDLRGKDFRTSITRNRSFRDSDLTGANFSGCDLRGCDFTRANLEKVKFVEVITGQTAWLIIKLIIWDVISFVTMLSPIILIITILIAFSTFRYIQSIGLNVLASLVHTILLFVLPLIISLIGLTVYYKSGALFVGPSKYIFLGALTISFLGAGMAIPIACLSLSLFRNHDGNWLIFGIVALVLGCCSLKGFWTGVHDIKNYPGTTFRDASLVGSNFRGARLNNCNFRGAISDQVNWDGAVISENCRFTRERSDVYHQPDALLIDRKGRGEYQGKNLSRQDLSHVDFRGNDLSNANLNESILECADLNNANLINVQANGTNFSHGNLTGACIQNWWINNETRFDDVTCDYIYLNAERRPEDRRPLEGKFQSGDFQLLIHEFSDALDFILRKDTSPQAFRTALAQFKADYPESSLTKMKALDSERSLIQFQLPKTADTVEAYRSFHQDLADLTAQLQTAKQEIRYLQGRNESLQESKAELQESKAELISLLGFSISQPKVSINKNHGDLMSDKSINPQVQGGDSFIVGGNNSGVVGKDQTGVAGGDISGTLTITLDTLKQTPNPNAQTLADHLKQIKTTIESPDAGLSDIRKAKALELLTKLAELAKEKDKSSRDFLEKTGDTLEELDTIVKKGSGLAQFAEKNLPTLMAGIRFLFQNWPI